MFLLSHFCLVIGEPGGCLGRWAKEGTKNTIVWFRKLQMCTKKGMNMMMLNETHVQKNEPKMPK